MAISKCRKGEIWKEALGEGVEDTLLEQELTDLLEAIDSLGDDTAVLDDNTHLYVKRASMRL